jgi:alpha-soluble NSF attachment protein
MGQAEKALKRFSLFSSTSKFEDAVELYQKAANQYKVAKKWQEAGDAFAQCAGLEIKLKSNHEASSFYVEAANCYGKVNPTEAITFFRNAIALHCESGRFNQAAKLTKQIAELFEQDGNKEEAITNYDQAADYYSGENSTQAANQCLLKVASYSAELEKYDKAVEIYTSVGEQCLESNLLKFNAKGHFLNAGLCILCKGDTVAMRSAVEKFKETDFTFAGSRECTLLEEVTQAFEDYNADAFTDVVFNFDNVSKLDPWKTSMLLRVKTKITEEADATPDLT